MWSQSGVRGIHTALLFSVCGAASSQLLNLQDWGIYLLPIPFGILAAWLCVDGVLPGITLVILSEGVWQAAYRVAERLGAESGTGRKVFAMCLAGLIGGLGMALATAAAKRLSPPPAALGIIAVAGTIGALPFAAWLVSGNEAVLPEWAQMLLSFAIWQGGVGFGLWWSFGGGRRGTAP